LVRLARAERSPQQIVGQCSENSH
jgi:hypothetical protein